jgi:hypothetical protein
MTTESRPTRAAGRPAALAAGALALLATAAALAGLLVDGVYQAPAATAEMLRAFDLVTLAVAPVLAATIVLARRGNARARLVGAGLAAHLVYAYAYYAFGTGFNDLFLLHTATLATGTVALILALIDLDADAVTWHIAGSARARVVAGILGVLAVSLGVLWSSAASATRSPVTFRQAAGSSRPTWSSTWRWRSISSCSCRSTPPPRACCGDAARGDSSWRPSPSSRVSSSR